MQNKIFFFFAFVLLISKTNSQVGPNLTAGAEGLVAKQGQLDAQLILDIIATKKGEVKSQLGQRLILNKLVGGPYALYDYTEKNLQLLFTQQNKAVITKELMKNSAELLLVYGMAEYLLQDLKRKKNKGIQYTEAEKNLIVLLINQTDPSNQDELAAHFIDPSSKLKDSIIIGDLQSSSILKSNISNSLISNTAVVNLQFNSPYLLKPTITQLLSNNSRKYREGRNEYYSPMTMLVDMIYDACINNPNVTSAGLFQSTNSNKDRYEAMSKFLYFDKNTFIYKTLNAYKAHVDSILTNLFSYYNLFVELGPLYETGNTGSINDRFNGASFHKTSEVDLLLNQIKTEFSHSKNEKVVLSSQNIFNAMAESGKRILGLKIHFMDTTKQIPFAVKQYLDLAYTIQKEIIPQLSTLNTSYGGAYDKTIDSCIRLKNILFENAAHALKQDETRMHQLITSTANYLPLLDLINNLNRVESYDYIFKFLTGIAETIGDEKTKTVIKAITTGVDKFTTIDKEKNEITLDVEGLAVSTFDRFSKNQHSRFGMVFLVGANHNISTGKNSQFITNESADTLGYSQFISEKIGVRWNVFDWNRKRSFSKNYAKNRRPMHNASKLGVDPLVNNLHIMLYGSGLLYKIQALNSAEQFTKPILGTGLGITFFNGLDFNVSYAVPYTLNFDKGFICLSFDIAITEYLTLARSKKKG